MRPPRLSSAIPMARPAKAEKTKENPAENTTPADIPIACISLRRGCLGFPLFFSPTRGLPQMDFTGSYGTIIDLDRRKRYDVYEVPIIRHGRFHGYEAFI